MNGFSGKCYANIRPIRLYCNEIYSSPPLSNMPVFGVMVLVIFRHNEQQE